MALLYTQLAAQLAVHQVEHQAAIGTHAAATLVILVTIAMDHTVIIVVVVLILPILLVAVIA
jgi:hypothetical protein